MTLILTLLAFAVTKGKIIRFVVVLHLIISIYYHLLFMISDLKEKYGNAKNR